MMIRLKRTVFDAQNIAIAVLMIGSFVGIWHSLPMLHVVWDEMYYVGGVLRAIQAHTLIPGPEDVPYGTITFYLNYIAFVPFLSILLVIFHFHEATLSHYLVLHPALAYVVPRFVNACLVCVFVWLYDRFLRDQGLSLIHRIAVLSVPLCTIIGIAMLHTGKMWVLSVLLSFASFILVYRALSALAISNERVATRATFWSVVTAFLAFANFPVEIFSFINIPILYIAWRHSPAKHAALVRGCIAGMIAFMLITALNYWNVIWLYFHIIPILFPSNSAAIVPIAATPHAITFSAIIGPTLLRAYQLLAAFPLVLGLIAIACMRRAIRNAMLVRLACVYSGLYFVLLVVLTANLSMDSGVFLRYLLPFAFYFSAIVIAFDTSKIRHLLWVFVILQFCVYGYVLYLLSVPTTYNIAAEYVARVYGDDNSVMIYNDVPEIDLPENKISALLTEDHFCGTKCAALRAEQDSAAFKPAVLTQESSVGLPDIKKQTTFVWMADTAHIASCAPEPVTSFTTHTSDSGYVSMEYNLGNYFATGFWGESRLGKNIYLYAVSQDCFVHLLDTRAHILSVL